MKDPGVHEKPIRRYRKIMPAFGLADTCRLVMGVIVAPDVSAEMFDDEVGACRTVSCLVRTARKALRITREATELLSQRSPLFTFWTGAHAKVVINPSHAVNNSGSRTEQEKHQPLVFGGLLCSSPEKAKEPLKHYAP